MDEVNCWLILGVFGVVSIVYLVLSYIRDEEEAIVRKERNVLFLLALFSVVFLLFGD